MDNRQKSHLHTPLLMLLCYILQLLNRNITSKTPHLPYMEDLWHQLLCIGFRSYFHCHIPDICDLSLQNQPSYQPMDGPHLAEKSLIGNIDDCLQNQKKMCLNFFLLSEAFSHR